MSKLKIKKRRKKRGFTLIEVMAVMAIIAILTAAFVPKLTGYFEEAKKVVVLSQAKTVITVYEAIRHKTNLTESSSITQLTQEANHLISNKDIDKLPDSFTIADCKNVLDIDTYNLQYNDGSLMVVKK